MVNFSKPQTRKGICEPDCEECEGIGFIRNKAPFGSPGFGKVDFCSNVDKWSLPGAKRYGLTRDEIEGMSWGSLIDQKSVQPAILAVGEILSRGYGWLYIHGPVGVGKTFILKIAIAMSLRDNREASYVRMVQIIDNLRGSYDSNNGSYEAQARLNWWSEIPILAIDEFDRVRPTEYSVERQFILMDRRYEDAIRKKSITIMASNKSPTQLATDSDPYLMDRIQDHRFKTVELDLDSRRNIMEL